MSNKTSELLDAFDIADLRFFLLIAKKNIKFIFATSFLVSLIVFFISLNMEKKYLSEGTIVIEPDENKIVNINEAYSTIPNGNRVNNLIAILESDEVIAHIVNDEKNQLKFRELYSKVEKNIFSRIFTKKIIVNKEYIKSILKENFKVRNLTNSDVLVLTFVSNNPKISQLALNNIIESYQRYEVDSKIKTTNYANIKVKERLKELRVQMAIADKDLAKYKRDNDLVDTGNVKELKIKEIQSISNNILASKQEKQKHENDLNAVKAADGDMDILLSIKDLNEREEISNIENNISWMPDSLINVFTNYEFRLRNEQIPRSKLQHLYSLLSIVPNDRVNEEYINSNSNYNIDVLAIDYTKINDNKIELDEQSIIDYYNDNLEEKFTNEQAVTVDYIIFENITNVSLKRLSTDKYIVSVSSLSMEISKDSIEKEILSYFTNIKSISFLSKFKINNALPSNSKFFDFNGKSFCQYTKNIYFAGDFLSSPCLNGAIQSAINLVESLDS